MDHSVVIQGLHEAEIGIVLTVGGWILMFPVRTIYNKAKEFFANFEARLKGIEVELSTQRTNCLTTLQTQGDTQIELLGKAVNTLEAMHLDQKQTLGMLQGGHKL